MELCKVIWRLLSKWFAYFFWALSIQKDLYPVRSCKFSSIPDFLIPDSIKIVNEISLSIAGTWRTKWSLKTSNLVWNFHLIYLSSFIPLFGSLNQVFNPHAGELILNWPEVVITSVQSKQPLAVTGNENQDFRLRESNELQ